MARKERHEEEEHENEERWLVTYADMITLLMVLFIVLFSMATLDASKFNKLRDSLAGKHSEASILEGSQSVIDGGVPQKLDDTQELASPTLDLPTLPQTFDVTAAKAALQQQQQHKAAAEAEKNNLKDVQQEIQASLEAHGVADQVKFTIDRRGLVITVITDKVLFASGKADLRPEGESLLEAIGTPLQHVPNDISIEGHTDNQPIATSTFPTNWELSTARATSVLRYMVDHGDVSADRIGATGFGEFRPAVPNDSDAHRAQNRRVEVVVLDNTPPAS